MLVAPLPAIPIHHLVPSHQPFKKLQHCQTEKVKIWRAENVHTKLPSKAASMAWPAVGLGLPRGRWRMYQDPPRPPPVGGNGGDALSHNMRCSTMMFLSDWTISLDYVKMSRWITELPPIVASNWHRIFLENEKEVVGTLGFASPEKNHVTPNPRGINATIIKFSVIGCIDEDLEKR